MRASCCTTLAPVLLGAWVLCGGCAPGCAFPLTNGDSEDAGTVPACMQVDAPLAPTVDGGTRVPSGCGAVDDHILTLNQNGEWFRFDPEAFTFTSVGTPMCPVESGAAGFTMARQRNADTWMLFDSGELMVTGANGADCESTGWQRGTQGAEVFAMAFVARPGRPERLHLAGDSASQWGLRRTVLMDMDPADLVPTVRCALPSAPELTGTGDGRLWAFLPFEQPPALVEVDPENGNLHGRLELPRLAGVPSHWSFAFHGGRIFIFLRRMTDFSTGVYRVDPTVNPPVVEQVVPHNTTLNIVGAAVSTCAPLGPR